MGRLEAVAHSRAAREEETMSTVTHDGLPIVEQRQTTLGLYVTAKEAYDMWQADPEGVKILDVRTPEEWVFTGHAPMATLVPFAFLAYVWDDEKKAFPWSLNPDFVRLVEERFTYDNTLLVTCRSGGRAALAINMLAKAGFTQAYNILDGMEGSRVSDPESVFDGMRKKNGWQMSGLPWTYELDPSRMALPDREEPGQLHAGNDED
jgi:rhodanese-related sulfurtransferase